MAPSQPLPSGFYTGNAAQGYPFRGDIPLDEILEQAIEFDRYEAQNVIAENRDLRPEFVNTYYRIALAIASQISSDGNEILDLGARTGIMARALVTEGSMPFRVFSMEQSPGMIALARYKFHQDERPNLDVLTEQPLRQYWDGFRADTHRLRGYVVNFKQVDFSKLELPEKAYDHAVAHSFMHWFDIGKVFAQLYRALRTDGAVPATVVWNSASQFYNDGKYPAAEYGFRYNEFLAYVTDTFENDVIVWDYSHLSLPKHDLQSIQAITAAQGFRTEQVGTLLQHVDFQTFLTRHVPVFCRELMPKDMPDEEKDRLISEALTVVVNNPAAFMDTKHKYDIVPIFRSTRL